MLASIAFLFNDCNDSNKWQFLLYKLRYNDAQNQLERRDSFIPESSFYLKVLPNFYQIWSKYQSVI